MRIRTRIAGLLVVASAAFPADRATLTGRVVDVSGNPLEGATVLVYRAGVKKGYSTYCPTCYVDCGKRATSDPSGSFTIQNLNPDLWFDLVVIRQGYTSVFVRRVDPSRGPAEAASLMPRAAVNDPTRVVRGRLIDVEGQPVRAAIIEPRGISLTDWNGRGPVSRYGKIDGLEPIAVSNEKGEFELAHSESATGMLLFVEPRGMAPKLVALPTGMDRKTIEISEGAVIRGRLMDRSGPVAGAEIGLIARQRGGFGANLAIVGNPYSEIRIGTQEDGSFVITNVPTPVEWYIYAKMDSIAARGATDAIECATTSDKEEVDVGEIQIKPGHRVRGKVTLSDGAEVADGMRIIISSERAWDSQTVVIGRDGSFEFIGLASGNYKINPSVRSYTLQGRRVIEAAIDRDIDDLAVALVPAGVR